MDENYEIVKKLNRLESTIDEMNARIDFLCKFPSIIDFEKYVDEPSACRILHISINTLYRLCKAGKIAFVNDKRKILYAKEDIFKYLENHTIHHPPADSEVGVTTT